MKGKKSSRLDVRQARLRIESASSMLNIGECTPSSKKKKIKKKKVVLQKRKTNNLLPQLTDS